MHNNTYSTETSQYSTHWGWRPLCKYFFKHYEMWSVDSQKNTLKCATRCHILRLKCIKFNFGWGSARDPAGARGSSQCSRQTPSWVKKGPASKETGGKGEEREGKGREKGRKGKGRGEKVRGKEGRGREGRGMSSMVVSRPWQHWAKRINDA